MDWAITPDSCGPVCSAVDTTGLDSHLWGQEWVERWCWNKPWVWEADLCGSPDCGGEVNWRSLCIAHAASARFDL